MTEKQKELEACRMCPRDCGVNRASGQKGRCHTDAQVKIARAALHMWEEPCLSGTAGSGAVFFSGCALGCIFCQNREISGGRAGLVVSVERLAEIFLELQEQGANNINLVTAGHYVPQVCGALERAKQQGLCIPVVYNSSGYEKAETLRKLEGLVDIYLPDLKYLDEKLAAAYSHAPDYPERAVEAIAEMVRQQPKVMFEQKKSGKQSSAGTVCADAAANDQQEALENGARKKSADDARNAVTDDDWRESSGGQWKEPADGEQKLLTDDDRKASSDSHWKEPEEGHQKAEMEQIRGENETQELMRQGVIVRHLLLPGHVREAKRVVEYLYRTYGDQIYISMMNQYTPVRSDFADANLNRRVTKREYQRLLDFAAELGVTQGFYQEGATASESFIPAFNYEGVLPGDVRERRR